MSTARPAFCQSISGPVYSVGAITSSRTRAQRVLLPVLVRQPDGLSTTDAVGVLLARLLDQAFLQQLPFMTFSTTASEFFCRGTTL